MNDAEIWVAVSFFLFLGVLIYMGVPRKLVRTLDSRTEAIARELEEARKLREEAESLLADYQRRVRSAETEAAAIIAQAEREAEAYARDTRVAFDEMLARRMKIAEEKIARAETKAMDDIRVEAADLAVSAAEQIIEKKVTGKLAEEMASASLERIKKRLH
jgi:F-type H+-transporting ATPase subunit b